MLFFCFLYNNLLNFQLKIINVKICKISRHFARKWSRHELWTLKIACEKFCFYKQLSVREFFHKLSFMVIVFPQNHRTEKMSPEAQSYLHFYVVRFSFFIIFAVSRGRRRIYFKWEKPFDGISRELKFILRISRVGLLIKLIIY